MTTNLAFSQACENNKQPILGKLLTIFEHSNRVLEIGSGTGQHAEFFSAHMPHLHWQASDIRENLETIQTRFHHNQCALATPVELDMQKPVWPKPFDAVFTANTAHIMAWPLVEKMIRGVAKNISESGLLCIYGPFKYCGDYTSDSNRDFENWLKNICPSRGIRDFEQVNDVANDVGLSLQDDLEMPANNRLIVWRIQ